MTVKEALQRAAGRLAANRLASPHQDAALLLATVLGHDRTFLYTYPEHPLTPSQEARFEGWLERRAAHYPLQYLRGHQEFFGRRFQVRPGVFIPRPETELLVEVALGWIRARPIRDFKVADVGTGSGCIAITLACEEPDLRMTATDRSSLALKVARHNAQAHDCVHRVEFLRGRGLGPLVVDEPRYHLIVSNPPYISWQDREQVDLSVLRYEPTEAVFAGRSGLEVYRTLFATAEQVLLPEGGLVLELGHTQAPEVCRLGEETGWSLVKLSQDLAGMDRCALFSRPG